MLRSGTKTYSDPALFQAALPDRGGVLTLTGPGLFKGRQTRIALKNMILLQVEETLPRIAFRVLPADRIHIFFSSSPSFNSIWGGVALRAGDIVVQGFGCGTHDRTTGRSSWGSISIEARALTAYAKDVAGILFAAPQTSQIFRPSRSAGMPLMQLHRKACQLAAKKPKTFANVEVRRALENELLDALVNCLVAEDAYANSATREKKLAMMAEFETTLQNEILRPLPVPKIARLMGVSERTLRVYCDQILGMGPFQYLQLRRLNLVRAALQHAQGGSATVQEVARHYRFKELGRFAATYRDVFGELPSATLRHIQ